jgi:hypothetical protein
MPKARILAWSSVVLLTLAAITAAEANDQRNFRTHLTGEAERPTPRETRAQGQAIFHLSADGTQLDYKLIASNIENVVQGHIHCGAADVAGPVVVFLYPAAPPPAPAGGARTDGVLAEGTITAANVISRPDSPTCPGGLATFGDLVARLRSGDAYVNVHTDDGAAPPNAGPGDFPGGEIRGQVR